jgi:hypothetical protein
VSEVELTDSMRVEAARLIERYDERIRLTQRNAEANERDELTGAMVDEVLDIGHQLDAACEAFRRRHFPHRRRVAVGLWQVFVTYRNEHQSVLDLSSHYERRHQTGEDHSETSEAADGIARPGTTA